MFCTSITSTGWLAAIWLKECSKQENNMILNCALLNNEYYYFTLAQILKHFGHCICFFWMPKVIALLVCEEQTKQFHKIPGIKFKLLCLYLFTKSVSILWLALIVTRVYQHFSNANISVKQICLGGGRGNVHFIPKKKTTYESNCSIWFL